MDNSSIDSIKGVFFDLDGTLKLSVPTGVDAVLTYLVESGIDIPLDARRTAYRFAGQYWADRLQVEQDMDRLGPDRFWANYIRAKLLAMQVFPPGTEPDKALIDLVNQRFASEYMPQTQLAPGSLELLAALRSRGLVIGLVSNRPLPLKEAAEKLGIFAHFNFTLAAGEIDSWKPDSGIFTHALYLGGGLRPADVLYVGDNYFVDVLGAQQAGLRPVLIDPLRAFPEAAKIALVIERLADLNTLFAGSKSRQPSLKSRQAH